MGRSCVFACVCVCVVCEHCSFAHTACYTQASEPFIYGVHLFEDLFYSNQLYFLGRFHLTFNRCQQLFAWIFLNIYLFIYRPY
ncbi:unnamed protein product [Boreogadus saida]